MDWKLLVIGAVLTAAGGFITFRLRKSNFNKDLGSGCAMASGLMLVLVGLLTLLFGFWFKG